MRGVRQLSLPPELVVRRPGVSPPSLVKLPSKRWRDLILRVWHVDPLRCPVCQNPMRVIASAPGTTRRRGRLRKGCRVHTPTNRARMWTRCPTTKTCSPIEQCRPFRLGHAGVCPCAALFGPNCGRRDCCRCDHAPAPAQTSSKRVSQGPALHEKCPNSAVDTREPALAASRSSSVSPKTNSPSPAQRSVRAGPRKAISYQLTAWTSGNRVTTRAICCDFCCCGNGKNHRTLDLP